VNTYVFSLHSAPLREMTDDQFRALSELVDRSPAFCFDAHATGHPRRIPKSSHGDAGGSGIPAHCYRMLPLLFEHSPLQWSSAVLRLHHIQRCSIACSPIPGGRRQCECRRWKTVSMATSGGPVMLACAVIGYPAIAAPAGEWRNMANLTCFWPPCRAPDGRRKHASSTPRLCVYASKLTHGSKKPLTWQASHGSIHWITATHGSR